MSRLRHPSAWPRSGPSLHVSTVSALDQSSGAPDRAVVARSGGAAAVASADASTSRSFAGPNSPPRPATPPKAGGGWEEEQVIRGAEQPRVSGDTAEGVSTITVVDLADQLLLTPRKLGLP